MDIHKPHAAKTWREFFIEIGTVVIGILIALALEQTLSAWHDAQAAREARAAIRAEIKANLGELNTRLAVQDCVSRRLDRIGDLLNTAQSGPVTPQPSWIGQPPIEFLASQRWQAATSSGRASLFDPAEQGRYAAVYVGTANFESAETREQAAWAQLRGLEGWRGPLGPAGRVGFAQALQTARYELWSTTVTAAATLKAGRDVGIDPPPPGPIDRIPHAVCLPIDTSREAAIRQLNDAAFGQPK